MIAIEQGARQARGEVLPPEPWHEGQVMAVPVKLWRDEQHFATRVQFEDGGVWSLPDRALQSIDPGDVNANIGEIFARWPSRFGFVRRERARYARRM